MLSVWPFGLTGANDVIIRHIVSPSVPYQLTVPLLMGHLAIVCLLAYSVLVPVLPPTRLYELHGTSWATIVKDPVFQIQNRRSTDLRDRFQNAFPELYVGAGYKPRPPAASKSQSVGAGSGLGLSTVPKPAKRRKGSDGVLPAPTTRLRRGRV